MFTETKINPNNLCTFIYFREKKLHKIAKKVEEISYLCGLIKSERWCFAGESD